MKFDTVVIGGGLAGLVCGISLAKSGQRCVIVSAGQSALHFSSGSFDLLNALPDGKRVTSPLEAVNELARQNPLHPYAKLGEEKFSRLAERAKGFLQENGIAVSGEAGKNHYRVTPMGTLKPTWLTLDSHLHCDGRLPWKKVAIFNVTGFLDFYSQFIADEFRKLGTNSVVHEFSLPVLEHLRNNPTEMRSTNIARVFDHEENLGLLADVIREGSEDCEAVILPAITGLNRDGALNYLRQSIGKPIWLLPTLPPSVPGIYVQQQLRKCFQQAGGVYMLGDTILKGEVEAGEINRIYSCNHTDIPFVGKHYVLATGSYFSQGLIAAPNQVYEPVFGLDVSSLAGREQWYDLNVFAKQQYQSFGVQTDADFHGLYGGKPLSNLYVAGAILEGCNPLKEGCGAGVSILSALYVAERILSK